MVVSKAVLRPENNLGRIAKLPLNIRGKAGLSAHRAGSGSVNTNSRMDANVIPS